MIDHFLNEKKLIELDLPTPDIEEEKAIKALNAHTEYEWHLTARIGDFVAFAALEGEKGRAMLHNKPTSPAFISRNESFECFVLAMNESFCRKYDKYTFGDPKNFVTDSKSEFMKGYFRDECAGPYLLLGTPHSGHDSIIPLVLMHKSCLQWVESDTKDLPYRASMQWMMRGRKSDLYVEYHHEHPHF